MPLTSYLWLELALSRYSFVDRAHRDQTHGGHLKQHLGISRRKASITNRRNKYLCSSSVDIANEADTSQLLEPLQIERLLIVFRYSGPQIEPQNGSKVIVSLGE